MSIFGSTSHDPQSTTATVPSPLRFFVRDHVKVIAQHDGVFRVHSLCAPYRRNPHRPVARLESVRPPPSKGSPVQKTLATSTLLIASLAAFAAAPPAAIPAGWLKLIDQLGDEDYDIRKAATKKISDLGEDVLPALRSVGKTHADVDVRLRALVIAAAITRRFDLDERTFTGSTEGVIVVAVSPDGKRIVSGCAQVAGDDGMARVWEVATGKELMRLKGHTSGILGVAWSRDGSRIVTGSGDQTLIVWDAKTGAALKTLKGHVGPVYHVALTPDSKKAVSCGAERAVRIWDLEAGKEVMSNSDNTSHVRGVAMMPDGKQFVTTGADGSIRLIDVATGKQARKMEGGHTGGSWFSVPTPDGKLVATSGADTVVRLWDSTSGKLVREFTGHTNTVHALAVSPDGKRLLTGGHDHSVRLWEIASGKVLQKWDGHTDIVTSAAFLPDGRHAVTSAYDRTLRLWNIRN
jgi:WD40 repeat protein